MEFEIPPEIPDGWPPEPEDAPCIPRAAPTRVLLTPPPNAALGESAAWQLALGMVVVAVGCGVLALLAWALDPAWAAGRRSSKRWTDAAFLVLVGLWIAGHGVRRVRRGWALWRGTRRPEEAPPR